MVGVDWRSNFGKKPESGRPVLVGTSGDRASHGKVKEGLVRDLEKRNVWTLLPI